MVWLFLSIALMFVCATAMYKGAEMEHMAAWPWAVLSIAAWGVTYFHLVWSILLCLLIQVGLFVVLGAVIFLRRKKPEVIK